MSRTIGSQRYTLEKVEVWAGRCSRPESYLDRATSGHRIFVAVDKDDAPVAYVLIEPDSHLDHLYAHPDHSRRGLADRLLAAAETDARAHGLARLYTEASDLARSAFERAGYTITQRRDFAIDGVSIHNWAMTKPLE